MDKVTVSSQNLGEIFSLSPEHWLSFTTAESLQSGTPLADIVNLQKRGTTKISDTALVLDTGHSDRGLLILPFNSNDNRTQRISNKKLVPEGAVLISRLRPYLQQVAYIPHGTCDLLGVTEILCSTEYYVLTSKNPILSPAFLVPWLLSSDVQGVFQQATTGGHHPRFNDELLLRLNVPDSILKNREAVAERVERLVITHLSAQLEMSRLVSESDD